MDLLLRFLPDPSTSLLWIVLLPLVGAIANGLFGKNAGKRTVSAVAVGTVAVSTLLAISCFVHILAAVYGEDAGHGANHAIVYDGWQWFTTGGESYQVPIRMRFVMDHLSGIMTVMVTFIATLIHIYSTEYMGDDPGYSRFMTYLNLFTASMLVLVLASNIPLMFVGWEGVGLCSYLLIGFWYTNPAYAAAGRKAFVVNRIGDFGVLLGTFLLMESCRTFEFFEINEAIETVGARSVMFGDEWPIGVSIATAASLFLFLGCAGKSAQIPLYVWLPDAMAGPTPVSALIHAATMVTAGIYLCCRLSPVFIQSETAMGVIAIVGALTALLGATIGLVQNQMKKILAYSTVSQLGFMFAAVGCGAFAGGFFHVFTHAFFKACLFLGAGSVMHAVRAHGDADIRYLGGMRKYMPLTHATFAIACAAIAGFPLLSGFFSKDEILLGSLEATRHLGLVGWFVFGILSISAFLTACYMFRLYFLTFWGEFRGGHAPGEAHEHDEHDEHHAPHESGRAITTVLIILAVGAVFVGFLGLPHWIEPLAPYSWWGHWLTGHGEHVGAVARWMTPEHTDFSFDLEHWFGPIAMAVGTLVGLGGIGLAYVWYFDKSEVAPAQETMLLRGVLGLSTLVALLTLGGSLGMGLSDALHLDPLQPGGEATEGQVLGPIDYTAVAWYVLWLLVLAVGAGVVGIAATRPTEQLHKLAFDKWRVDETYGAILVSPFRSLAVFSANIDRIAVDGLLTWVPAQLMRVGGYGLSMAQNGLVYVYTIGFAIGTAVVIWWFTYPHVSIESEVNGATVAFAAERGPGYQYRWDFDSDREWDTDWRTERSITHEYGEADSYLGLVADLLISNPEQYGIEPELRLTEEPQALPLNAVSENWARAGSPESPRPASIAIRGGSAVIRANDASVVVRGRPVSASDDEITLAPGEIASVGPLNIRIAVRAAATVQVRSVFGNLATAREELTLVLPRTELAPIAAAEVGR